MNWDFLNDLYQSFVKKQTLTTLKFSDDDSLNVQLEFLWDEFVCQAHDLYQIQLSNISNIDLLYNQHRALEYYLKTIVPVFFEDNWWYDNHPDDEFRDDPFQPPLISLKELGLE